MIRIIAAAFWLLFVLAGGASAQTCSVPITLANGNNADANQVMANFNALLSCINAASTGTALRGYLSGLTLATLGSSSTFSVAAGVATSSDFTTLMKLPSSLGKTTGAWAVGSGNGALDTGSITPTTWYHVFLMQRQDTGVVDICVSITVTGCTTGGNIPSAYTLFRRIGSMKTDGSAHWILFVQNGDEFLWALAVQDYSSAVGTTAVQTIQLLSVPTGVKVDAILSAGVAVGSATDARGFILSPDASSNTPGTNTWNIGALAPSGDQFYTYLSIRTNTSGQVIAAVNSATAGTYLFIGTQGWVDRRGRDN
jgi:hypothetical protein